MCQVLFWLRLQLVFVICFLKNRFPPFHFVAIGQHAAVRSKDRPGATERNNLCLAIAAVAFMGWQWLMDMHPISETNNLSICALSTVSSQRMNDSGRADLQCLLWGGAHQPTVTTHGTDKLRTDIYQIRLSPCQIQMNLQFAILKFEMLVSFQWISLSTRGLALRTTCMNEWAVWAGYMFNTCFHMLYSIT